MQPRTQIIDGVRFDCWYISRLATYDFMPCLVLSSFLMHPVSFFFCKMDSPFVVPDSDSSSVGWSRHLSWKLVTLLPNLFDLSAKVVTVCWRLSIAAGTQILDSGMVTTSGAGDSGVGDGTWREGPVRGGAVSGPEKRKGVNTTLQEREAMKGEEDVRWTYLFEE